MGPPDGEESTEDHLPHCHSLVDYSPRDFYLNSVKRCQAPALGGSWPSQFSRTPTSTPQRTPQDAWYLARVQNTSGIYTTLVMGDTIMQSNSIRIELLMQ